MAEFKRGDQIKYVGGHDFEYGFVTEVRKRADDCEVIFCRFWSNFQAGEIHTLANSESCNPADIVKIETNIPRDIINAWLVFFGYEI